MENEAVLRDVQGHIKTLTTGERNKLDDKMIIFSRCRTIEEKEFYLKLVKQENYSKRELDRQISASLFERTLVGNSKLSTVLRESLNEITISFKDSYVFDFLKLIK
jgi:predicted nuclease of restriction endonuclease-like (RecB) superfamily